MTYSYDFAKEFFCKILLSMAYQNKSSHFITFLNTKLFLTFSLALPVKRKWRSLCLYLSLHFIPYLHLFFVLLLLPIAQSSIIYIIYCIYIETTILYIYCKDIFWYDRKSECENKQKRKCGVNKVANTENVQATRKKNTWS